MLKLARGNTSSFAIVNCRAYFEAKKRRKYAKNVWCRESRPLCRLKNPTLISIWLLVGFHPATRSVQSTPADNTRKSVWQYIEKESALF